MFAVVVRLEQGDTKIEFKEDATNGPNIARLRPAQFEDDFRRPIMARRDDRAVMFVVESGASKIDQTHISPFYSAVISLLRIEHFEEQVSLIVQQQQQSFFFV